MEGRGRLQLQLFLPFRHDRAILLQQQTLAVPGPRFVLLLNGGAPEQGPLKTSDPPDETHLNTTLCTPPDFSTYRPALPISLAARLITIFLEVLQLRILAVPALEINEPERYFASIRTMG